MKSLHIAKLDLINTSSNTKAEAYYDKQNKVCKLSEEGGRNFTLLMRHKERNIFGKRHMQCIDEATGQTKMIQYSLKKDYFALDLMNGRGLVYRILNIRNLS